MSETASDAAPGPAETPADDARLRAAFVDDAMQLLGPEAYARNMGVSHRSARYWATGERNVKDRVLRETMQLLVAHRQRTSDLIRTIRAHLDGAGDGGPTANLPPPLADGGLAVGAVHEGEPRHGED